MNIYTWIFLICFVLHHGLELTLALLQIQHLKGRKDKVPKHLVGKVDLETIRKSVAYNLEKLRFGMITRIAGMIPLWLLILWGFTFLDDLCRSWNLPLLWTGLIFVGILNFVTSLLGMPADLYFTFVIEQKHGFNKQRLADYFKDQLKHGLIGLLLGGSLLLLILFVMESVTYWWLLAYGVVMIFQLLMMWIYPLIIMPLFNKFEPVPGELADAVKDMSSHAKFSLKSVVSMDGSKRSAHSNAFIIGFKSARRIVLFDTLIEQLPVSGLVGVLAHELGHFKLGHIKRRLMVASVLGLGIFALLYWMSGQQALYTGLGFSQPSNWAALIVFGLLFGEMTFPFGFISRLFSRRDEYAADRFAVDAVKNSTDLCDALLMLSKKNLSSPGSHKWYRTYYNSHPSLRERLAAIRAYAVKKNYPIEKVEQDPKQTSEE